MTPAARLEIVMELLNPPIYDEDGNIVGYQKVGLITKEQALELLNFPEEIK